MQTDNLYEQTAWDVGYQGLDFTPIVEGDQVAHWLQRWTQDVVRGSCLEIGCFPGRYLALFGERGFELNGVDLTPRTSPEMVGWLRGRGYRIGEIQKTDFFQWKPTQKFEVVYSNGFVEHFSNWEEVLLRHAEFVKPGGRLLVSAPNFRGAFQKFFHHWVDRKNLSMHYLPSMDPELWSQALERLGFKILYTGYFDRFDFWVGVQERTFIQKWAYWTLRALIPVLNKVLPRNSFFSSPYCGVVAERPRGE